MHTSKLALVIGLACAGGAAVSVAPPASAQVGFSITVGTPPPPPRFEPVPPPRPGFVWAPGYWSWGGQRYVWVPGTWYRARPGYVYVRPRWVHERGRWVYHASRWSHDRDWRDDRDHDRGRHSGWDRDRDHGHHGDHDYHH